MPLINLPADGDITSWNCVCGEKWPGNGRINYYRHLQRCPIPRCAACLEWLQDGAMDGHVCGWLRDQRMIADLKAKLLDVGVVGG